MSNDPHEEQAPPPPGDPQPPSPPVELKPIELIGRPGTGRPADFADAPRPARKRRALVLFLLTCVSVFFAQFDAPSSTRIPRDAPRILGIPKVLLVAKFHNGLMYAGCLMTILTAHELGHYLQARRYGVPASLPYFIPFPLNPFGTMGAVIVQQSGVANRKSMFDIAISGPLAGLVFTLPVAYWGLSHARVVQLPENISVPVYGDPLLLKWMVHWIHGPIPEGSDVLLNPVLFAGWVGIFITALNLIPIGQLDGGHILYCLIGRKAHYVARGLFLCGVAVVGYNVLFRNKAYLAWILILVLMWLMGTRHPPTANDRMPLGPGRVVLGWLTLLFVFIGLTPTPMYEVQIEGRRRPPAIEVRADGGEAE